MQIFQNSKKTKNNSKTETLLVRNTWPEQGGKERNHPGKMSAGCTCRKLLNGCVTGETAPFRPEDSMCNDANSPKTDERTECNPTQEKKITAELCVEIDKLF